MSTFITLLTGGGLLAVGSILAGLQTNRFARQRDQTAQTHQLHMAQEARQQDRLDRTYTELGIFLSHWESWARSVHPFMGPVERPVVMAQDELWRIETLVANHGSPEVRRLLDVWGEQRLKIVHADITISMAEQHNSADLNEQARQERLALEDHRKALHEAATAIRDRMWLELNGQAAQGES
jgi:hypothetical protein